MKSPTRIPGQFHQGIFSPVTITPTGATPFVSTLPPLLTTYPTVLTDTLGRLAGSVVTTYEKSPVVTLTTALPGGDKIALMQWRESGLVC
jgi:hypothetical protein